MWEDEGEWFMNPSFQAAGRGEKEAVEPGLMSLPSTASRRGTL